VAKATKKTNGRIVQVDGDLERFLKCDLKPEELAAHAQRLAELEAEVEEKTAAKKAAAKNAQGVIDALAFERKKLAEEHRQRWGYRDVRCRAQKDMEAGEYQVVREDLDVVVERRPLNDSERQGTIAELGA